MGVLQRFDGGDLVGGMLVFFVLGPWVGVSNGTEIYGYSIVAPAFTAGGISIAMSTVGIWVGTVTAYVTNQSLKLDSILNRPTWEKAAVALTLALPVVVNNVGGLEAWMLESYVNGTLVGLTTLIGFIIVSYRRVNDAKLGFVDTVAQVADPS
jgi:hypothetical protein